MLPSVHDHTLLEYSVSLERATIAMRTRPSRFGEDVRLLVFEACEAHHFKHVSEGSILGHIVEHSLPAFVAAVEAELNEGFHESGWPAWWRGSISDAIGYLNAREIRAFEITSAYGFSGWVLARSVRASGCADAAA